MRICWKKRVKKFSIKWEWRKEGKRQTIELNENTITK